MEISKDSDIYIFFDPLLDNYKTLNPNKIYPEYGINLFQFAILIHADGFVDDFIEDYNIDFNIEITKDSEYFTKGDTALSLFSYSTDPFLLKTLIKNTKNIHHVNSVGDSYLMSNVAGCIRNKEVFELLQAGIDLNHKNFNSKTVFDIAKNHDNMYVETTLDSGIKLFNEWKNGH